MDKESKERIRSSRERFNLLKEVEFRTIEWLCPRIPGFIKPDHLTVVGLFGSMVVFLGLFLATTNRNFLFLSILGFAINWFGDSLDGRIAYYRNTPRKWYGWALDINVDWISACIIGLGFYYYFPEWKIVSFIFVVAYGGSMIVALTRYKISDQYTIDSMFFGPTELRIVLCLVLLAEMVREGTLLQFAFFGSVVIVLINMVDSFKVFKLGDERDKKEKAEKLKEGRGDNG